MDMYLFILDYRDSTEPICTKLGEGMGHDPWKDPFNLGADRVKWADLGILYHDP